MWTVYSVQNENKVKSAAGAAPFAIVLHTLRAIYW